MEWTVTNISDSTALLSGSVISPTIPQPIDSLRKQSSDLSTVGTSSKPSELNLIDLEDQSTKIKNPLLTIPKASFSAATSYSGSDQLYPEEVEPLPFTDEEILELFRNAPMGIHITSGKIFF